MLLEKTQRRLCRFLFVVGCVLPTLAVAGFTANRFSPAYSDTLLAIAGKRVGASVACKSLTTPRPGVYELHEVSLSDPTSGREFLSCQHLRLTPVGEGGKFEAQGVALRRPADGWLFRMLSSGLVAQGEIDQLVVESNRYQEISFAIGGSSTNRRLRLTDTTGAKVEASLDGESCHLVAETGSHALPASWLPTPLTQLFNEGMATFLGELQCTIPTDGSPASGKATGELRARSLELNGVVAERGTLAIETFEWSEGRVDRLVGQVDIREGRLSRPVVYGMCRWLVMEPFDKLEERYADLANQWFDFSQLACELELDDQGLVLVAGCGEIDGKLRGGAIAHAVLEHNSEPLLREPLQRPLPAQRLVQAWYPDDPAELPATPAAVEMMSRLPGAATH